MKFVPETLAGVNVIVRHDAGPPARLWVGAGAATQGAPASPAAPSVPPLPIDASVFVPWVGAVTPWALAAWSDLAALDFERMAAFGPELVIFGSGARMRFAPPALLKPLVERGIGIECMDTAAACRTYNVLVSERRSVLAALLLGVD